VEIPNRPAFRSSEVCEIAQIPAYVLRSWEKEFPGLGVLPKPGAPRVYRRADVEQVLRIKHLLFNEGLTLAGARRKLEGEPKVEEEPLPELPLEGDARAKVARIKQELRSLLDILSGPRGQQTEAGTAGTVAPHPEVRVAQSAPESRLESEGHGPQARREPVGPSEGSASRDEHGPATWPPARPALQQPSEEQSGAAASPAAEQPQPGAGEELPLLDGVPEKPAPPKAPRRARRPSSRTPHGSR
jgi:DNA-binding transcriptional MerR regulator